MSQNVGIIFICLAISQSIHNSSCKSRLNHLLKLSIKALFPLILLLIIEEEGTHCNEDSKVKGDVNAIAEFSAINCAIYVQYSNIRQSLDSPNPPSSSVEFSGHCFVWELLILITSYTILSSD